MNALLIFFYLFSDHPRCCRTPSRTPLNLQSVIKGLHDMLLLVRKCNPSTLIHPFTRLNDEAKIEVLNTSRPVHLAYSFGKFTCFIAQIYLVHKFQTTIEPIGKIQLFGSAQQEIEKGTTWQTDKQIPLSRNKNEAASISWSESSLKMFVASSAL